MAALTVALVLAAAAARADEVEVRRGAVLFDRPWRAPPGQDAPGPLLAARSCAACHPGGDAGSPDVPALTFRLRGDRPLGRQLQPLAVPGAAGEPLPHAETDRVTAADGTALERRRWRVAGEPAAARLAPSLRGLALLARIPAAALLAAEDPGDRDRDGDGVAVLARPRSRPCRDRRAAARSSPSGWPGPWPSSPPRRPGPRRAPSPSR